MTKTERAIEHFEGMVRLAKNRHPHPELEFWQAALKALRFQQEVKPSCTSDATDADVARKSDTYAKPRLAEVLGVKVGELFHVQGDADYRILPSGWPDYEDGTGLYDAIITAINHPEHVARIHSLTEAEMANMRDVGARWVTRNDGTLLRVDLWDVKPFKTSNKIYVAQGVDPIARIKIELFPSVGPGELIGVGGDD